MDSGESVTYDGYTYTTDGTKIKRTKDGVTKSLAGDSTTNLLTTEGWVEVPDASPIVTKNYNANTLFLADGSVTDNEGESAAKLEVKGSSKSLTVKNAVTGGVDTTGDTVAVTDEGTDTVYTLAEGVTMTANTAAFTTTSGTVSDMTGTLTLKSGSVTTSVANANFDISATENADAKVTFATGTTANGAVIKTVAGSITLTEGSVENPDGTATFVTKDGSIGGIDKSATIHVDEGTYTVNGTVYNLYTGDASFIVDHDRIYITSGTCSLNAKLGPVFVANADVSATSNIYVSQQDNDTIVIVADGKYTISGLKNGTEVQIDNITFTYDASSDSLTYNTKSYKSVVDGKFTFKIVADQDMPVSNVTLDSNTFDGHDNDLTLYYSAEGEILTENTENSAVTVTRKAASTKDDYTVTVNSRTALPIVIDGVAATVSDSNSTGTEYNVNGVTFTSTDSFTVDAGGIFTETGGGLTVKSGAVNTSDADARIDLSTAEKAIATFVTGTAADGAVITIAGGSITLTESGKNTPTVVYQDGSVSGLDGNATVTGVPAGNSVITSGAGTFSVNGISVTISGSGGGITPDAVEATNLTLYKVAGVTSFSGGTISFTAAADTTYNIVNQTIAGGNGSTVGFVSTGPEQAYLYSTSDAITLEKGNNIEVSDAAGTKTSRIAAGTNSAINLGVASGTYTISGLNDGEMVTIDGKTYTYTYSDADGARLMNGIFGWQINSDYVKEGVATVSFNIADDTATASDTIISGYGEEIAPSIATQLAELMEALTAGSSYYFDANGKKQASETGKAYTLARDGSKYTLTSTSDAATALTIDLTNVDGSNLTIDLSTDGATAQNVKLGADTTLAGLTLGAGDSVLDDKDNALATAGNASGTVTVAKGKVTALTGGTFVGVGEHTIAATADVTIDGVTFAAGATGTFTNGTTDTFAVTAGTASIGTGFNGTKVTANGVDYTVESGTVAAFSGTANTVDGFTAGKITFAAADNTPYTIGGQTISDGNGATLTFVPTGLYSTGTGKISLGAGKSITISDENGTNTRQIAAGTGSALDVAAANGEYTISGLDALGESVDIVDSSNSKVTYEVVDVKSTNVVLRKTVNGADTYWQTTTTAEVTDGSCGTRLYGGDIVTSNYDKTTYFLANGLPYADKDKAAATLTVYDKDNKELKVKPALTVNVEAKDNVKIIDEGTTAVYTLAADSHVKTKDAMTFTTASGVVSDADGTLVLQGSSDSLTAKGTVNVDARALLAGSSQQSNTPVLRSGSIGTGYLIDERGTAGSVTYQKGTAVNGAVLTLGQDKSLTLTEATNGTDTVYTAGALAGLDSGAEITTSGLSDSELASITTAAGGTFTVNGITFEATDALKLASVADTLDGTLTVDTDTTIIARSADKNYNYKVAGTLYNSVSAGVKLTSTTATLASNSIGQTVTVDGHDTVTNNGTVGFDVSSAGQSAGQIRLAKGMQFTMGKTDYVVDSEITSGYVGTEDNPVAREGCLVTVTVRGETTTTTNYLLLADKLEAGTYIITDDAITQGEQGEVWDTAKKDILLSGLPITVNSESATASYNKLGFPATSAADTAAKVTRNDDGTYTVAVTDEVVLGVKIDGVTASLSDNGTGTSYTSATGTFQLHGSGVLSDEGVLTFDKAGSSVTINGYTYTFDKVNDKVSLDATGKLTGLTDGEKVTVTKDGATITYEVSGGELLLTKNENGKITTTTNLLAAGEKDGFIILEWKMEAVNRATDTAQAQNNTGLEVNTEGVDDVTNGMLLDKDGQATLSEDKAIATVTIQQDDSLKYTAKENKGQAVKITNQSTKDWDITASNKKDTVEYDGSGEAVIHAGAGNDNVSITGSGEVRVFGDSGRNTIIHTGSGDATLQGGTGNDTIKSSHADDVILGGDGKDTFVLTNVETKVSDFTYGEDKAVVTSTKGTLDPYKVKVGNDGTISYAGTGSTSGSLDVSEQGYGDFYAATLADSDGHNPLNVGWLGSQGGMIDASSLSDRLLLLGNEEGNIYTLGGEKFTDTLIGGQSRDTIIAGTGDSSLWGGAGNDLIESNSEASHTIFFLEGDGNDTVTGFTAYGEDSADTLDFLGQSITKVKHTSQGIQLYHGSDKMTLTGNFNANTMIKWESGDAQGVAKIGRQGEDNKLSYNEDVNVYLGSTGKDTISIGADDDNVEVWLDGSRGVHYDSVEIIDASRSTGTVILAGDAGKNTIIGGSGSSSLWGGTGSADDNLKGGSGENVFYYGLEEGDDVIMNSKSDDTVMLYNLALSDLKAADIETNKITITQQNGQHLTVNGQASTFTLSDGSTWLADHAAKSWSQLK
ncbi:hypothetical protein [Selenomonas sp. KH1T6]|uniref:hypothetical protein n=1 Tax=Selenomonas sp. KH1T6 TaxID=3158784 RepID=UPI001C31AA98